MRDHTIDNLKAIGMFLVIYGHFVEKIYRAHSQAALAQWKLIYAFHVPMFFFMAGFFFKPQIISIASSLLGKMKTRLLPVVFFALINLPFFLFTKQTDWLDVIKNYACGIPVLNYPTWFLICLFLVEATVIILSPFIASFSNIYFILLAITFFVIGLMLPHYSDLIFTTAGLPKKFWFLMITPVALGFYLFGFASKKIIKLHLSWQKNILVLFISGFILLATFNLNDSFSSPEYPIMLFLASDFGNPFWFMVSAVAGIVFMVFFAKTFMKNSNYFFDFIGKRTVIYLGFSGVCCHFLDDWFVQTVGYIPQKTWQIVLFCSAYTILVFLIFAPVAALLKNYFPVFAGGGQEYNHCA